MPQGLTALPVVRTLGGCGGTLLSRLLGALPRTIVLSETNPRSANLFDGHLNPLRQLRKWRPELLEDVADFDEAEIGYPPCFGEMLQGIAAAARRYGYLLIVRDFNYADFLGVPFIWPPSADSSLDAALEGRFSPRSAVLVRHPADQLASLRAHRALGRVLAAERFIEGSHKFLESFDIAPIFRYEALAETPEPVFHELCQSLGVPFSAAALTEFVKIGAVTGSLARAREARITAAARSPASSLARQELANLPGYDSLLARLGYEA